MVPATSSLMWNDVVAVPLERAWVIIELGSLGSAVAMADAPAEAAAAAEDTAAGAPLAPATTAVDVAALLLHAPAMTTTSPARIDSAGLGTRITI
jgi:hypothetical protein